MIVTGDQIIRSELCPNFGEFYSGKCHSNCDGNYVPSFMQKLENSLSFFALRVNNNYNHTWPNSSHETELIVFLDVFKKLDDCITWCSTLLSVRYNFIQKIFLWISIVT